jgi:Fur family transcriptional regulator, ferric uptake regulator
VDLSKLNQIKSLKNSKNTKAVIKLLNNDVGPVSADYIYEKLREINPSASMSTVYRVLEKLTLNNIISKSLIMNDNKARYEIKAHKDIHYLICLNCGKMLPTYNCHFQKVENKEWKDTGFVVTGHKVELYGFCADCKNL